VDALRDVTRASGYRAKESAWLGLIKDKLPELEKSHCPVTLALCRRVRVLDELFRTTQWIRRSSGAATIPDTLRKQATARCMEELTPDQFRSQTARMQTFVREWNALRRQSREVAEQVNQDPEAEADARVFAARLNEELANKRLTLRLWIKEGELNPLMVIAHASAWLTIQIVDPEVFESIAQDARDVKTGVRGHPFSDGEQAITLADLRPMLFDNEARDAPLLALNTAKVIRVVKLKDNAKSQTIIASW
jgi:hypothetical protein